MRIAMWSGPRNLSTALMYAFAARGDCEVWDEPFYACYLRATGLAHPMAAGVMAADARSPERIAAACRAAPPSGKAVFYQKHMCQHMIEGMPRGWMTDVTNVFLIRHPDRVLASFSAKYEDVTLSDIGFAQQAELFDQVAQAAGAPPLVIDSADIRKDPRAMLERLCKALGIGFAGAMLRWSQGPKPYDGVWAPVWYASVHRSTGFAGPEGPRPALPDRYRAISEAAQPYYERLAAHRLSP